MAHAWYHFWTAAPKPAEKSKGTDFTPKKKKTTPTGGRGTVVEDPGARKAALAAEKAAKEAADRQTAEDNRESTAERERKAAVAAREAADRQAAEDKVVADKEAAMAEKVAEEAAKDVPITSPEFDLGVTPGTDSGVTITPPPAEPIGPGTGDQHPGVGDAPITSPELDLGEGTTASDPGVTVTAPIDEVITDAPSLPEAIAVGPNAPLGSPELAEYERLMAERYAETAVAGSADGTVVTKKGYTGIDEQSRAGTETPTKAVESTSTGGSKKPVAGGATLLSKEVALIQERTQGSAGGGGRKNRRSLIDLDEVEKSSAGLEISLG